MVEVLYRNRLHRMVDTEGDYITIERAAPSTAAPRRVPLNDATLVVEPTAGDIEQAEGVERAARRVLASLPAHCATYEGAGCPVCQNYIRYQENDACILCGR